MAEPLHRNPATGRKRRRIGAGQGCVYVGDAARVVGLEDADYAQVQRLLAAARGEMKLPASGGWRTLDFQDIVELAAAFQLAGGQAALAPGRRLRLRRVRNVVNALRDRFGVERPLLSFRLEVRGQAVVAFYDGRGFEPQSGQLTLDQVRAQVLRLSQAGPDAGVGYDEDLLGEQVKQVLARPRIPSESVAVAIT